MTASEQLEEALEGVAQGQVLYNDAYNGLREKCMADSGFTDLHKYDGGGYHYDDESQEQKYIEASRDEWWGVSLPEYAQKYGYHSVPRSDFMEAWESEGGGVMPPTEYANAEQSCHEQWEALAYADVDLAPSEIQTMRWEIPHKVKTASHASDAATQASSQWSQCMAKQGYSYDSPNAALAQFVFIKEESWGWSLQEKTRLPTDEELRIAVVDAQCKVDVGFWDAIKQAENEAAQNAMTSMRPQIEQLRQANALIAENSAKIIETLGD